MLNVLDGLLKENDIIVPYEVTFNTMKARQFEAWVNYLNINSVEEYVQLDKMYYDIVERKVEHSVCYDDAIEIIK